MKPTETADAFGDRWLSCPKCGGLVGNKFITKFDNLGKEYLDLDDKITCFECDEVFDE